MIMSLSPGQGVKRVADRIFSAVALLLMSPVLLVCAILNLILNGRPVFYASDRHVQVDKAIRIPKFRSMVRDAKDGKHQLEARFMRNGFLDIPLSCEVYTPFGRILERLQIVEVPQFLCVLKGEMSIIGNRPLPASNVQLLKVFPGWEKRFNSPAGITGISQIVGKLNLEPVERLRLEGRYSEIYQNGNVLKCDLLIAWFTLRVVFQAKGITLETAESFLDSCLPKEYLEGLAVQRSEKTM
jgi:lipopolysaccharide/colanic/teichoic acid biosynthesis glycosyltransferase